MPTLIDTNRIRTDLGTQPRIEMNDEIVKEYSESMGRHEKFPAIDVIYDDANDYFILVDGFHRLAAHKMVFPNNQIYAEIKPGTVNDATWDCLAVNQSHGLRRTNADKRNAVEKAFLHPKGAGMSNRNIAKHVGVGEATIRNIRREKESSAQIAQIETRTVERKGKTYQQKTTNIGNHRAQTIKMTGSGFTVVNNPPPSDACCGNCRNRSPHDTRTDICYCMCDCTERTDDEAACEWWAINVPDKPVVTNTAPPTIVPDDYKYYEPPSIRGAVGPYEKTRDAVRILFHLKNPELAACELRNTCDFKYMTSVWASYKKLVTDPE